MSIVGVEFAMASFISSDLQTEWKSFLSYITNQLKDHMYEQLKELYTSSMLESIYPNLSTLVKVCLTLPKGTASVEHSFLQMKMIKTRLNNCLREVNLSHLMKTAIESAQTLSEEELEQIAV